MECLKTDFDVRWSKTSAATICKEQGGSHGHQI